MELTLKQISDLTDSKLVGNPEHIICGVSDLKTASSKDASFFKPPLHQKSKYEQSLINTNAGVIFVSPEITLEDEHFYLINEEPSQAFQLLLEHFFSSKKKDSGFSSIHESAVIHPEASLGNNVTIHPNAVIDREVTVGDNTIIGSGCYIGPGSSIGEDCLIHARVTIRECCSIGNRVILQPGVVVGSCGFGYTTDSRGIHTKLKQIGDVVIEDDVEIGANVTIDRARFKTTKIGQGTKIDNLVQIAHGVTIGKHCFVVAQTGIAGSTEIGNHVVLAGQVAVNGHIKIADGVIVAARSGVTKSVTKPGKYGGTPLTSAEDFLKKEVHMKRIDLYVKRIKELEKKVEELYTA